jgi:hypothetical protein
MLRNPFASFLGEALSIFNSLAGGYIRTDECYDSITIDSFLESLLFKRVFRLPRPSYL